MDLWVVAAAAGAGYLTKYWQKLSRERDKDGLLPLYFSDANLEKSESSSSSVCRHGDRKPVMGERGAEIDVWREGASDSEVASTSGYEDEKLASLVSYQHCNLLSLSNISPVYQASSNENGDVGRQSNDLDENSGGMVTESSKGEKGSFHVPLRNRRSLRTEHSHGPHIVKPLTSLESCLMAQLYKGRAESSVATLPSTSALSMRPLIVSDGNQIISRANGSKFSVEVEIEKNKLHEENCLEANETSSGIPPLPKLGCLDLPKKLTAKGQTESSSGEHLNIEGPSEGAVLHCLGVSIGVISSFIVNRKEVDKLKDVLKQTKSLVEDLQEELEMKESVMVTELANENFESQDARDKLVFNRALNSFSSEQNMDKHDGIDSDEQKAESSESISNIEAELEAELVRLGLNMSTSSLKGRFTDRDELDPELVADFAQGELRAEMVGGHTVSHPESEDNTNSSFTAHHHGNYAVSPRELSLRLHEVIQSRLEERIQELEAALQRGQKEECISESDPKDCSSYFTNNSVQSTVQERTSEEQSETIREPPVVTQSSQDAGVVESDCMDTRKGFSDSCMQSSEFCSSYFTNNSVQSTVQERTTEEQSETIREPPVVNQSSQDAGVVESNCMDTRKGFSDSCMQSSEFTVQCSDLKDERQTIIEPLVLNLAGEALDADNEAYEELMKLSESEEEDLPGQVIETFRDQMCKQSLDF